jgi:hypothetical protein
MSDPTTLTIPEAHREITGWNADLNTYACIRCDWRGLVPRGAAPTRCPNCYLQPLTALEDGMSEMPYPYPPELVVPFRATEADLARAIGEFSAGIPYPPEGLTAEHLRKRLAPVFLPMWLVDAKTQAYWQTEAGFDYKVVSHQETYQQNFNRWATQEVQEDRIRWERRVGRLRRTYHNVNVPALEEADRLAQQIGEFDLTGAKPYQASLIRRACVRLPDRSPEESWNDAAQVFEKIAAEECRDACGAGHLRQFRWKANFDNLNWTLMLLPAYTAYYLDDENHPHPVMIHGQTGKISGPRRASLKRAWQTSLIFLIVGLLLFLVGGAAALLGGSYPTLHALSTLAMAAGLLSVAATVLPLASAWGFNRQQVLQERANKR